MSRVIAADSDSYQYDTNTGRLTQYKFSVNGQSAVGNLAWNEDGTLPSLAITEVFALVQEAAKKLGIALSGLICSGMASARPPWRGLRSPIRRRL